MSQHYKEETTFVSCINNGEENEQQFIPMNVYLNHVPKDELPWQVSDSDTGEVLKFSSRREALAMAYSFMMYEAVGFDKELHEEGCQWIADAVLKKLDELNR